MKHTSSIFISLRNFLIVGLLTLPVTLNAGNHWPSQLRFAHHNEKYGLSSNDVRDIYQAKNKTFWIATANGLNKFDIHRNEVYQHDKSNYKTLSSNLLTAIASGLDDTIWVGTESAGLNHFDPRTNIVERISTDHTQAAALPSNHISQLAVSEEKHLWIGTDKGLAVMNLQTRNIQRVTGTLANAPISHISIIGKEEVWVGTQKGEMFHWDTNLAEFRQIFQLGAPITTIKMDTRMRVWIGTSGAGLYRFNNKQSVERVFKQIRDITSITSDESGDLWVGTKQGLARIDKEAEYISIHRSNKGKPQSLGSNHITKVYFDKDRRMIWAATKGAGTSRTNLDQYLFPLVRNGEHGISLPSSSICAMAPSDNNSVWIGTERGVFLWKNDTQEVITQLPNLEQMGSPYVISLMEDTSRNLWVGTKGEGIYVRSPNGEHLIRFTQTSDNGLGHNYITSIFQDQEEQVWIGTLGAGLFKFIPKTQKFDLQNTEHNKPLEYIRDIKQDPKGRIWVAAKSGLFFIKPTSKFLTPANIGLKSQLDTLPEITCLHPHGDFLWLGTRHQGVLRVDPVRKQVTQFESGPENTTLPEAETISITSDSNGVLWIASTNGISRIEPNQMIIRNFDHSDGLQPGQFHKNAYATLNSFDSNTTFLFGGSEGFNPINPDLYPRIIQPPFPMLTDFEYFFRIENPSKDGILEKPLNSTTVLPIPFDKRNQFAFRFANLDYRFPKRGHFRYRLMPYESKWVQAESDHRASYRSVPVGKYTFEVQSSVDGQKWTQKSAKIEVRITPPWYASWWFRTLAILLFLVSIFLIGRTILKNRIRAIERREARISAERDKAEVALARQLQQGVLLDRTSSGLNQSSNQNAEEIFSSPLRYLLEHFKGEIGMIYQVSGKENEPVNQISLLANESLNARPISAINFEPDDQLIEAVLDSDVAIALEIPEPVAQQLESSTPESDLNSVLFMSTRFMDQANGLIIIFSNLQPEHWNSEEITIFNSLSQQFGMTIAQLRFAQTERKYRKRLEMEKKEAELANHAKSDFLAKMTHELRTPLNSIIGFTEIVKQDGNLSKKQGELINIVNRSGDHLLDVVNDILDLSKIEAGQIEKTESAFEILPLLKSVYEMLKIKADAKGIGFKFVARNALPDTVYSDRSKIRQTLINLIGNAVKFTDQGEVTLAVDVDTVGSPEIIEGEVRRKLKIFFEITDTGKGIAQNDLPKLFEKYAQTESGLRSGEGTGLGLPIAKSFINLLGGNIKAESEPGKGTVFTFHIECDEVAADKCELASNTLTEEQAHKINGFVTSSNDPIRILIAEDQPNNRLLLRKILGRAGFEMLEAENGQEAIELNNSWQPHLILMDEDMPIKRGSEATKEIMKNPNDHPPVIVSLTAYALEQAKLAALESGCKDFLAKPFRTHEIFEVISRHLQLEYTFKDAA